MKADDLRKALLAISKRAAGKRVVADLLKQAAKDPPLGEPHILRWWVDHLRLVRDASKDEVANALLNEAIVLLSESL